jgi:hypothetical protein
VWVSGHYNYAFLLDENLLHLSSRFPKGRAKTIVKQARRQGTSDPDVVREAFETKKIIVTSKFPRLPTRDRDVCEALGS